MFKKVLKIFPIIIFINLVILPTAISDNIYYKQNNEGLFGFKDFFAATPIIDLQYAPPKENVIPNAGVLDISLEVTLGLAGSFRKVQEKLLIMPVQIKLSIENSPEWCDASIANPTVSLLVGQTEPFISRLTLAVTEQAPAFHQGTVKVKATSEKITGLYFTRLKGGEFTFDISFEVGYWPKISYSPDKGTIMKIKSSETADFPITVENIGNGPSIVQIETIELPEDDWNVNIASSVNLGSPVGDEAGDFEKTVHLFIKPPSPIKNEDRRMDFKIKFTPHYLGNPSLTGKPETITFFLQVESDESLDSENGYGLLIGSIVVIIILIIATIIFLVLHYNRKSK